MAKNISTDLFLDSIYQECMESFTKNVSHMLDHKILIFK